VFVVSRHQLLSMTPMLASQNLSGILQLILKKASRPHIGGGTIHFTQKFKSLSAPTYGGPANPMGMIRRGVNSVLMQGDNGVKALPGLSPTP